MISTLKQAMYLLTAQRKREESIQTIRSQVKQESEDAIRAFRELNNALRERSITLDVVKNNGKKL